MDVLQLMGCGFSESEEEAKRAEAKRILVERDWKPKLLRSLKIPLFTLVMFSLVDFVRWDLTWQNVAINLFLGIVFEVALLISCAKIHKVACSPEYDWAEAYREEDP